MSYRCCHCHLQSLQALEKISHEHPTACLRAGALIAVLSYLDFFSTGVQVSFLVVNSTEANSGRSCFVDHAKVGVIGVIQKWTRTVCKEEGCNSANQELSRSPFRVRCHFGLLTSFSHDDLRELQSPLLQTFAGSYLRMPRTSLARLFLF